jgi:hypothetical protein
MPERLPADTVLDGGWRAHRYVGSGGLGDVYMGYAPDGSPVAIKLYHPRHAHDFRPANELGHVAALELSGVFRFVAFGQHQGRACLVTRWEEGEPFGVKGSRRSPLEVAVVLLRLLYTLRELHQVADVIHGDIKPSNVLVRATLHPVLIDFDAARHPDSERRPPVFDRLWAPPELLLRRPAVAETDLYAAALCAWLALTGEHAHSEAPDRAHAQRMQALLPEPPPDLRNEPIVHVLHGMLARDPERRTPIDHVIAQLEQMREPAPSPHGLTRLGTTAGGQLTIDDLASLFRGPRRLLDLPGRAAALLLRRSGGILPVVAAHVRCWIDLDLVRCDDEGRLHLSLEDLEQLESLLDPAPYLPTSADLDEATAELLALLRLSAVPVCTGDVALMSDLLPTHAERQLEQLVIWGHACRVSTDSWVALRRPPDSPTSRQRRRAHHAGLANLVSEGEGPIDKLSAFRHRLVARSGWLGEEAVSVARALMQQARPDQALRLLEQVAESASREPSGDGATIARLALEVAVDQPKAGAFATARRIAQRCSNELVAAIAQAMVTNDPEQIQTALRGFDLANDPDLRLLVQRMRAAQLRRLPFDRHRQELDSLLEETQGVEQAVPWRHEWEGTLHYREADYRSAAEAYRRARDAARTFTARMRSLTNESAAWVETDSPERALELANQLDAEARRAGHGWGIMRAAIARRIAMYRMDRPEAPDAELVEEARCIGWSYNEGQLAMTEAAFAWRQGDLATCHELAVRGFTQLRRAAPDSALLCAALAARAGGDASSQAEVRAMAENSSAPIGVLIQVLGLADAPRALMEDRLRDSSIDRSRRREVLSLDEALALGHA